MTIVKTSEIIEWVKNAVEKKMIKELNIPNASIGLILILSGFFAYIKDDNQ